jgi:hypothetical protein
MRATMRVPTSLAAPVAILVALALSACGSDGGSGSGGAGGSGDGKVHPAGNGQHQSQADACDALSNAQDARSKAMSCTSTLRPCPTLILVMAGGTECLEYDQGSVQGCVDYYNQQATCDDLAKAIDACVVTAFQDSAPNGCP